MVPKAADRINGGGRAVVTSKAEPGGSGPVIGITTYSVLADWADWPQLAVLTPQTYTTCIVNAGASPMLLPPASNPGALSRLDGLMLIGGEDVCGRSYGRTESDQEHVEYRHHPERDAFEIAATRWAWARDVPILAICRGIQVLNVALGGSLIGDLFSSGASPGHRLERGVFHDHRVTFDAGSALHRLYGEGTRVPSHHHQAIDELADDLLVTGRAEDGVIEAVEAANKRFVVGVQWHPEEGDGAMLFETFVESCRGAR